MSKNETPTEPNAVAQGVAEALALPQKAGSTAAVPPPAPVEPSQRELELEIQLWTERTQSLQMNANLIQHQARECQSNLQRLRGEYRRRFPQSAGDNPNPNGPGDGAGGGPGEGPEGP